MFLIPFSFIVVVVFIAGIVDGSAVFFFLCRISVPLLHVVTRTLKGFIMFSFYAIHIG